MGAGQFHAQDLAGPGHPLRENDVILTGLETAARVIVTEDDAQRVGEESALVDFSGMSACGVQGAARNLLATDDQVRGIEHDGVEALPIASPDIAEKLIDFHRGDNTDWIVGLMTAWSELRFLLQNDISFLLSLTCPALEWRTCHLFSEGREEHL
jgi:hypothetical protein